jgi:hypothetical protein
MGYTNVSDARASPLTSSSDTSAPACIARVRHPEEASTTIHRGRPGHARGSAFSAQDRAMPTANSGTLVQKITCMMLATCRTSPPSYPTARIVSKALCSGPVLLPLRSPVQAPMQDPACDFPRSHTLKLSEKGVEQRSDREFGRHTYHEMGQKGTLRRSRVSVEAAPGSPIETGRSQGARRTIRSELPIHPTTQRDCMKKPQVRANRLSMRRLMAAYTNASPLAHSLS